MKMVNTMLAILFFANLNLCLGQTQLGSDLNAVDERNWFGAAVSMSENGDRIAVGARANDNNNGLEAGQVRVYEWMDNDWQLLGNPINGEAQYDRSGYAVSLSAGGDRVAIGAPFNNGSGIFSNGHVRVYEWKGADWVQIGQDINGAAERDLSGSAVAISADGNRVVIGAPHNPFDPAGLALGYVRVYEWTDSLWVQVGQDLFGETAGDEFGSEVAISVDGNRVAIAAPLNEANGLLTGQVRVFEWSNGTWVQMGDDLNGVEEDGRAGRSLAMSADGSKVAIGGFDTQGGSRPVVRIYEWVNGVWTQLGTTVYGADLEGIAGALALSASGNRLVVGIPTNDETGFNSGKVRVYDWANGDWNHTSLEITGENEEEFGTAVALSSDGSRVVVGASSNGEMGIFAGQVRVYALSPVTAVIDPARINWDIYPNPTTGPVNVSNKMERPETVRVLDQLGRVLIQRDGFPSQVDISGLPQGAYLLQAGLDGQWVCKTLIKQ